MLHQPITAIPAFATAADMLAPIAGIVRPKVALTVSEWAILHRSFDDEALPWQREVMDALGDPETAEVGLQGPPQSGKTEIGLGWMGWSIEHDPAGFMVCQPDKAMADDFVKRRINPMVRETPILKAQLLPEIGADNIFLKQFRAMLLTTIWPVLAQFRARPVPRGWIDDYDAIDANIEGKGSAVALLDDRATTFEGRDKKFVSSSPQDENGGKIEAFVTEGTHERLMPVCPQCAERIELDIRRDMKFDDKGTADEAEASVHVICPANGCVLMPDDKRALLDSLMTLPNRGFVAKNTKVSKRRRGFWVDGLLAFLSWRKLAWKWRMAQIEWATLQSEAGLAAFFNSVGYNYRSILNGEKPLTVEDLAKRREKGWKLGVVPAGPVVMQVLVDVQADRFECMAVGVGADHERWIVDRWAIHTLADGLTSVQPLRYAEHWAALIPLFSRTWPLADGSGQSPSALTVAIDARGGAAELALRFWHMCAAAGVHPQRLTLLQGGNNPRADLISRARRSDEKRRGGVKRNSPAKWTVNTHWAKNILDARWRRTEPGPGYIHLPEDFSEQHLDEATAEELIKGKWVKIRPRNETLDMLVQSIVAFFRAPFAGTKNDMRWVPAPFRIPKQEKPAMADQRSPSSEAEGAKPAVADVAELAVASVEESAPAAVRARKPRRSTGMRRPGGWMGRLS